MKRKPRAYVAALPISALPDLKDLLAPFFGPGTGATTWSWCAWATSGPAARRAGGAGLFGSRSEAAAFLIGAGIHAQRELFARIAEQAAELHRLRDLLHQTAREALSATAPPPAGETEEPAEEAEEPEQGGGLIAPARSIQSSGAMTKPTPPGPYRKIYAVISRIPRGRVATYGPGGGARRPARARAAGRHGARQPAHGSKVPGSG